MPGVNLSQSMPGEESSEKRSFFDMGILLSLGALIVVGLVWGGIRFYMSSLDKKIADIEVTLGASTAQTKGGRVDRVADFETRLKYFSENKNEFEPEVILKQLEGVMVSGVLLTGFQYDQEERLLTLSGKSDDFRKLADQMFSFKTEKMFSQVRVETIDRDDENKVTFVLKAGF